MLIKVAFLIAIWLIISLQAIVYSVETQDGLHFTTDTDGRITDLTLGSGSVPNIAFCSGLNGGFYIRDNTLIGVTQLPAGCVNLLDSSEFGTGSIGISGADWTLYRDTTETDIINSELSNPTNHVASVKIDQSYLEPAGHVGVIYQTVDFSVSNPSPDEHELYYLSFEVKTECGWRSLQKPNGFDAGGGRPQFGPHNVSARVEWFENDPVSVPITRNPHPDSVWNQFFAYGTSENMDGGHLTRFCGRSYRPRDKNYARIVLQVEGYMPYDGPEEGPSAVDSEVYFDNIYFFEAPLIIPVSGTNLFDPHSGDVPLFEYGTTNELNLSMNVSITPHDKYLLVAGELINTHPTLDERAIDLGFAFPIKDDSGQSLEWHYDVRNSIDISGADSSVQTLPFTFTGPIDCRPECKSSCLIPTSAFEQNHNQQISVYPISSLGIDLGSDPQYGLAFGDDLTDDPPLAPFAPSISHFGYHIVEPGANYNGYYFVEFNIGLLASAGAHPRTAFSFIIFRSDNPDLAEESSFREGLEKYQKDIFPNGFKRPTNTNDDDWLFGGGRFIPERVGSFWDTAGFTQDPNDFGFRYVQGQGDWVPLLNYCFTHHVGFQIYDLPWKADFDNNYTPLYDQNTYSGLDAAQGAYNLPGTFGDIYDEKVNKSFTIPPNNQEIFGEKPYSFPVYLADSPIEYVVGSLVDLELGAYNTLYSNHFDVGKCFSGIEFDNTFDYSGDANHLDLTDTRMADFVGAGGRLTYSFNHFKPAIPSLCTNTWFFPHVKNMLEAIDESRYHGDNNDDPEGLDKEQEIISVNANESEFGGSKYGIINADVIGFESSADKDFNNSNHAFNFRRSVARDKSVSRHFGCLNCIETAMETIFTDPPGPGSELWPDQYDLETQIFDEVSWIALAWGFHPSIQMLFPESVFGGQQGFDRYVESVLRKRFQPSNEPAVGYTEIFRQLHLAGWKPVTNVVNSANSTTAPGDPTKLYIERFGPYEAVLPATRPVYVTALNNDDFTITLTDVVDYESEFESEYGNSISDMKSDLEVEFSKICDNKYGNPDEYGKAKIDINTAARAKDKNFYLDFSNLDEMTLDDGNLHGMQMIKRDSNNAVNWVVVHASNFTENGQYYSLLRFADPNSEPKIRLGGFRIMNGTQQPGVIPDKALMAFKIWAELVVDNDGQGGDEERSEAENPYYQRFGDWSTVSDETARRGSVDVVSSLARGAYALFSIDIAGNARYDIQVAYPDIAEATTGAKYEVYLRERNYDDETGETEGTVTGPVLTTIVDQSQHDTGAMDESGFISIGEIEASRNFNVDRLTVVVKVSSAGGEYRGGEATVLMADAVKVARIGR
jgi:hypothetical protein